jgi:hypothetical protein
LARSQKRPLERSDQDQRRGAADKQQLPYRIGAEQPFSQSIIEGEKGDSRQHQANAGKRTAGKMRAKWWGGFHSELPEGTGMPDHRLRAIRSFMISLVPA